MSLEINAVEKLDNSSSKEKLAEMFKRDGCIGPFKLYEKEKTEELLKSVRVQLLSKENAVYSNANMNYDRHLDVEALRQLVNEPAIVDKVKAVLGDENILCWRTEWFPKYPGDSGTMWHQAQNFRTFGGEPKLIPTVEREGPFEVTVWFGFTDARKETGCLKVIPGSHGKMHFDESVDVDYEGMESETGFFGYDFDKTKKNKTWSPDESKARHIEMTAGEFTIFTSRCIHGSEPNSTKDQIRMGLAVRYA